MSDLDIPGSKIKVGDLVRIKSLNQLRNTAIAIGGEVDYDGDIHIGHDELASFVTSMRHMIGETYCVELSANEQGGFILEEESSWIINDWMVVNGSL